MEWDSLTWKGKTPWSEDPNHPGSVTVCGGHLSTTPMECDSLTTPLDNITLQTRLTLSENTVGQSSPQPVKWIRGIIRGSHCIDLNSATDHIPFELYVKNKHTIPYHTIPWDKLSCQIVPWTNYISSAGLGACGRPAPPREYWSPMIGRPVH
jgi:hypothetical protein